jgi:hypothetical protein
MPELASLLAELLKPDTDAEDEIVESGDDDGDDVQPPPTPLEWAYLYRRLDNKPLSLEHYRPLEQIYADQHPFIVIEKPAQKGVSELAVTRACHFLDVGAKFHNTTKSGLNVGYIFSTDKALSSFSKERFSGLRMETEKLQNLFTEYDSVFFKKAGDASYLHLAGGKSTASMKSFAADLLILDEYDEIVPTIVALAEVRMNNSVIAHEMRLSTPTFPNKGIDELYLQSDQNVWEVHCPACGEWNELNFLRDARADGEERAVWKEWTKERLRHARMSIHCPTCGEAMDTFGPGRWTALKPEIQGYRGYRVPALSVGVVNLTRLAVKSISTDPSQVTEFYRSDLGVPYTPMDSCVTDEMLSQLSVELPNGRLPEGVAWTKTTMGVDGGKRYHYRISSVGPDGARYVRKMGALSVRGDKSIFEQLDDLMSQYKVRQAVIDGSYDPTAIKTWADKHKGKVRRAFYPNSDFKGELFRLPAKEEKKMHGVAVTEVDPKKVEDIIQVNRTMAMDAVFNLVATAAERWPAAIHNDPEVVSHMKAPVRVMVKDENGNELPTWVHKDRDDLYHTCVYDMIAEKTLPNSIPGSLGLASVSLAGMFNGRK